MWISVEEQIPPERMNGMSDPVLVYNGDTLVAIHEESGWFDTLIFGRLEGVTHWMYIPEAPWKPNLQNL